ncbi:MAG: hypothetical protein V3R94_05575 [Acidobacteriota bacterium]
MRGVTAALTALIFLSLVAVFYPWAAQVPDATFLTDQELEQVSLAVSGAPRYFDTDNLISNEISHVHVIPKLREVTRKGGAYLGVGPDQNFTYMVHVQPQFAVIIDVRRDNLLQQLFFKQIIEFSADRWEYLSYLFGKQIPSGFQADVQADAATLVEHFRGFSSSSELFEAHFNEIWSAIRTRFPRLTREDDRATIRHIAGAFFEENLQLRFRSHGRRSRSYYPTYQQLITEADGQGGLNHYLNSESGFQFLKQLQSRNQVVPVIGDLAGPKAVRSVGKYLEKRGYLVSAVYLSNVESYLLQDGRFPAFIENLSYLPMDRDSVVIRSYFNYRRVHPLTRPGYVVTSLLQRLETFLHLQQERPYRDYWDVVSRDFMAN